MVAAPASSKVTVTSLLVLKLEEVNVRDVGLNESLAGTLLVIATVAPVSPYMASCESLTLYVRVRLCAAVRVVAESISAGLSSLRIVTSAVSDHPENLSVVSPEFRYFVRNCACNTMPSGSS